MKVLYCVRLFSGLQSSVESGTWNPTGVPTIFKIMEALDKSDDEVTFVLTCKDRNAEWLGIKDRWLRLGGFLSPVCVLAGSVRFPKWFGRLRNPFRELAHIWSVLKLYRNLRPDVVYFDHANVFLAGFMAAFTEARVVLRIMGVYPVMRAALSGGRLGHRLMRWCYGQPYSLVLGTQDGSGSETWLDVAISNDVPRTTLINGLDSPDNVTTTEGRLLELPDDRTIVMFLGKPEPEKGALQFAEAFLRADAILPDIFHALMVGTGSEAIPIQAKFDAADVQQRVTHVDRMPHSQVVAALHRADIYVSLNRLGNLSNANLEAMSMGRCMVIPESQPVIGVDLATDEIISPRAAIRISSTDDVDGLARTLVHLQKNPKEREQRGLMALRSAAAHVPDWTSRIQQEMTLLQNIACGKPLGDDHLKTSRASRKSD